MTTILADIRRLLAARSNVMQEWTLGTYVICYRCGFVSWRRRWEQDYLPGWDAAVFLEALEAK
jgi:hypothetical protein